MARLSRRIAGRRVAALAESLADDLLRNEQRCFTRAAAHIGGGVPAARAEVRKALRTRDVADMAAHARLQQSLVNAHMQTLAEAYSEAQALLTEVTDLATESIGSELWLCERTLAARYKGAAEEAMSRVEGQTTRVMESALDAHRQNAQKTLTAFQSELRRQLLLAGQHGDTQEQMEARLFSPEPVSRPGIGGRGVWYRSTSWVDASTRDASISVMNGIRMSAMAAFNQLMGERSA